MSVSKINYRVAKRLSPHLESRGFSKALFPREWVKVQNNVLCAIHMMRIPVWGPFSDDISDGSFALDIGVEYPVLEYGVSPTVIDEPERNGIGVCSVRATPTRSAGVAGPRRAEVWCPATISPDEAIADAITAIDSQAMPFFEKWTNPEYAYSVLSEGVPARPQVIEEQGKLVVKVSARSASTHYRQMLATLAATLGRVDEEIQHIEELRTAMAELNFPLPAQSEERLAYLRSLPGS